VADADRAECLILEALTAAATEEEDFSIPLAEVTAVVETEGETGVAGVMAAEATEEGAADVAAAVDKHLYALENCNEFHETLLLRMQ
jgi:hypothetical protein